MTFQPKYLVLIIFVASLLVYLGFGAGAQFPSNHVQIQAELLDLKGQRVATTTIQKPLSGNETFTLGHIDILVRFGPVHGIDALEMDKTKVWPQELICSVHDNDPDRHWVMFGQPIWDSHRSQTVSVKVNQEIRRPMHELKPWGTIKLTLTRGRGAPA